MDDLIVGIDIGSNKIITVISEIDENGNPAVIGVGKALTQSGVRTGVVVNIEAVVNALNESVENAEIQAGREIDQVIVGISGSHIDSINSKGIVAISGADKEIRDTDIDRVIEAAKAVAIPLDREILHIIPQGFTVDGQENIQFPIGMVGTRLECQVHILTTAISSIQNVVKCLNRSGLDAYDIVLQNIAASRAVLTADEKELGVLMIDLGAQTTKVSIYYKQAPYFNSIYQLGGYLISNDLSAGLKIPFSGAEKLKLASGVADFNYVDKNEVIQIPSIGGRNSKIIARGNLIHIIKPRVEEIFTLLKEDLKQKGFFDKIGGGIVLTGGSALLPGITEVCQEVFDLQTRIGYPYQFGGLSEQIYSPEYAVVSGLILWGYERMSKATDVYRKSKKEEQKPKIFKVIKNIFDDFF